MDNSQFGRQRDAIKRRRVGIQVVFILVALVALVYTTVRLPSGADPKVTATPSPRPTRDRLELEATPALQQGTASTPAPQLSGAAPLLAAPGSQYEQGFVALSYVGVGTEEGETVISDVRLKKHLDALHARGFVTISQQDIYDFYYSGKPLPGRALFLFFEDGRYPSARLANPLLKALGYHATMLSYADNLEHGDPIFLNYQELQRLRDSGVWEIGTNGYRLSYINVFDRHKNFLGELTPFEYRYIAPYLRREYNHYLMDFVRDKYDVPVESHAQMQERVEADYQMMDSAYTRLLGGLPQMYVLMHANTGQFATNSTVSVENEKWIRQYFQMNFNREMLSLNRAEDNIFDLTRMQPQSYWSVNHLLMRIYYDIDELGAFEPGNAERASHWDTLYGAAEWDGNTLRLTSLPAGEGRVRLKDSAWLRDFTLETTLDGNKLGRQSIEILADPDAKSYTAVELEKNTLRVLTGSASDLPRLPGQPRPEVTPSPAPQPSATPAPLFELDLDKFDGVVYQTWEQNRQEAMAVEIDRKLLQTYLPEESKRIAADLIRDKADLSHANHQPYIPEISLIDDGSRHIRVEVKGGSLSLWVDGKSVLTGLSIPTLQGGGIALRSAWLEYGYSQRNLADDVYDADFTNLLITDAAGRVVVDYRGAPEAPKATPLPAGYSGVSQHGSGDRMDAVLQPPQEGSAPQPTATPQPKPGLLESIGDWFRNLFRF